MKSRSLLESSVVQLLFACGIFFCLPIQTFANPTNSPINDTSVTSTQQQAIEFVDAIKKLEKSALWPNIKPDLFLQNLKTTIHDPISIYAGNGTNFCGYAALTYLLLLDDPLGYSKLMIQLYREGKAVFGNTRINPSAAIKKAAGLLRFKGIMDIHPADQMFFLSLADHFKGYLNILNRKYDPGDEDRLWASVNYAKFNRMVRHLLHYKTKARGADLIRPRVGDIYRNISKKMETGTVVLFINNRMVHKKNHVKLKLGFPTHFIVAEKISSQNDLITFVYWDYGGKTLLQLSPAFFKRIVFGITYCTKNGTDAN